MIRDKRGVRRRFIYGQPTESKARTMQIKRADPRHPLLRPGQCRVENGAIVVMEFTSPEQIEGYGGLLGHPSRSDPMGTPHRFLAWLSVEMARRFRSGMAEAIRLGMTQ